MIKMKKKRSFLPIILIICMVTTLFSVSIPVFAETSGEYTYSINSDNLTCTITKYNGVGGNVAIPSSLDAYTVTAIGDNAFKNITSIAGITIPNSVTTIGAYGFSGDTNLNSISIPNSVTTIGNYAFMSDGNLNNITIPNGVTSIGVQAFTNCSKLSSITIPNSVTSIPFYAFSGCSKLSSITIPNSVTSIEAGAFRGCSTLKNVIIPNSVTSIKSETFAWCGALESITIPNSVTSIEENTFSQCSALKNIIIPNSVTSIKAGAFSGCKALESITIPKSVMSIGDNAFFSCEKLTSIYFDGNPSLGSSVFYNCPSTLMGYSPAVVTLPGISCTTAAIYSIAVNSSSNGFITPSTLSGMKDATISLQMIPADGYTSDPSLLQYNDGTSDVVISGTSFAMPDKAITISGGFEQIPIPTVTSSSATTNDLTPTWSWIDATGEGYYRYKLNGESWKYTTLTSFTQATNLTDGTYTLYVQEINNNGDWSDSGSAAVTITFTGSSGSNGSSKHASTANTAHTYTANVTVKDTTGINNTATTLTADVDQKTGIAALSIGSQQGNAITDGGTVAITVPSITGVTAYTLGIPVAYLSLPNGTGILTFNSDTGSISLPANMLAGIAGAEGKKAGITIGQGDKSGLSEAAKEAIGARPLIQLAVTIDGKQIEWNNPNTPITISIPYKPTEEELENLESIIIWYIDGSGNAVSVPNGHYDSATGTVTFTTTHFSYYAVGYSKVSFKDVAEKAWYSDAVGFIAARDITTGTGNGNYAPGAKLTRGQFIVMVMKTYGIAADTDVSDNFTDAGNTYYTSYLAEAKRLGITAGVGGNLFAPGREITRQEMFTLLYNTLKAIDKLPEGKSGNTLSAFSDAGQIATWATDAMGLMVETGTISGSGGKLAPTGSTTRAEMAQVLYNLML